MKLRQPLPNYDWRQESERNRLIEAADDMNHKKNRDVEIGQGRLILTDDTTGTRYELSIDNGGLKVSAV